MYTVDFHNIGILYYIILSEIKRNISNLHLKNVYTRTNKQTWKEIKLLIKNVFSLGHEVMGDLVFCSYFYFFKILYKYTFYYITSFQ